MRLASVILTTLVLVGMPLGVFIAARESSTAHTGSADPNTIIDIRGAIGGVRADASRSAVERLLGSGFAVHHPRGPFSGAPAKLTIVRYPASRLVVVYVPNTMHQPVVFAVATTSMRYHTPSGLGVGSSLTQARHTAGVRCFAQRRGFVCEGGLGYEKPVTSFLAPRGRVTEVILAAVAD